METWVQRNRKWGPLAWPEVPGNYGSTVVSTVEVNAEMRWAREGQTRRVDQKLPPNSRGRKKHPRRKERK